MESVQDPPGEAMDKDLYDLPAEEARSIPTVCHSLDQALDCLMPTGSISPPVESSRMI